MRKKKIPAMTKKERIAAVLEGKPADRLPRAYWMTREESGLCGKADLLIAPDWREGAVRRLRENQEAGIGTPPFPEKAPPLSLLTPPLDALEGACLRKSAGAPVVMPVYSPLLMLGLLHPSFPQLLAQFPEEGQQALEMMTETACALVRHILELGADGILLVVNGSAGSCTRRFYKKYGRPYDLAVLGSAAGGWCNILRSEGEHSFFSLFRGCPAPVFSWDDASLSMEMMRAFSSFVFLGGVPAAHLEKGEEELLMEDVFRGWKETGGERWILAPSGPVASHDEEIAFTWSVLQELEERR